MKNTIFGLAMLAALILAGCISPGPDLDLNPFFRTMPHEGLETADHDRLLPFGYARTSPDEVEWGVRPLFTTTRIDKENWSECDFFPPLGRYTDDGQRAKLRFWPLYWYTRTGTPELGEDVDWIFFPLLFGGHSPTGENYFAIFPLGGRVRNFLGFDTWDFFLWPLFQRVKTAISRESVSTSLLFLYGWTTGGKRDGSFKVLPFYQRRLWENKYRKYSVLWPFLHYQENGLDTRNPSTLYGFWPLFTYESSPVLYRLGLIGPLFFMGPIIQASKYTPERWEGEVNDSGHSYYIYDLPFPLVHMEKTKEYESFRVFPFYSHFSQEGFDSKAFLIPLFWKRKEWNEVYEKDDFFFVPLFHSSNKRYREGGEDDYLQIWPVFHHAADHDGRRDFSVLSLLPLRTENYVGAMDKVLWPFWNLYRYRRDSSGASRHDALFGLITAYNDPYESRFSFPLLYSYENHERQSWEHRFLLGLFSLGGDEEGLKKLRILFIPFLDS